MNRVIPVCALLAVVALPRLAAAGISWEDGPVKASQPARIALTGKLVSITWEGRHGRVTQRLPAPRPLDALGELTPPPGEWDALVLNVTDLGLDLDGATRSLSLSALDLVLTEPVRGGVPLQLTLDVEPSDRLARALDADDPAALRVALQDAAALSARAD